MMILGMYFILKSSLVRLVSKLYYSVSWKLFQDYTSNQVNVRSFLGLTFPSTIFLAVLVLVQFNLEGLLHRLTEKLSLNVLQTYMLLGYCFGTSSYPCFKLENYARLFLLIACGFPKCAFCFVIII